MAAIDNLERHAALNRRAAGRRRLLRALKPWLFLFPLLFFNVLVIMAPSLGSVYFAFTEWSGIGPAKFTGLENFRRLFGDPVFWRAFTNNIIWTLIFLTVPIAMGLLGAALLAPVRRGQVLFRTLYFIPYVIASAINARIWSNIMNPSLGLGVQLAKLGLPWADIKFLGDARVVLYAIAFVDNWHWWGFLVVLYLAAMQGVDFQLYEAAQLEGANRWQEFWHVTLPGIRPTLVFTLLFSVIGSFLVFDYVYLLTQGGPANASEVLSTMSYKAAFARFEAGYAAAIGLTTSFICLGFGLLFVFFRRRGWEI
jgi:raffinose/stachyose/melibiose transport system permease protein